MGSAPPSGNGCLKDHQRPRGSTARMTSWQSQTTFTQSRDRESAQRERRRQADRACAHKPTDEMRARAGLSRHDGPAPQPPLPCCDLKRLRGSFCAGFFATDWPSLPGASCHPPLPPKPPLQISAKTPASSAGQEDSKPRKMSFVIRCTATRWAACIAHRNDEVGGTKAAAGKAQKGCPVQQSRCGQLVFPAQPTAACKANTLHHHSCFNKEAFFLFSLPRPQTLDPPQIKSSAPTSCRRACHHALRARRGPIWAWRASSARRGGSPPRRPAP